MLGQGTCRILGLSLGLPLLNLGLLTGKCSRIVGEIVCLNVVGFNAVEEIVGSLRQERVNADGQVVEGWGKAILFEDRVVLNLCN